MAVTETTTKIQCALVLNMGTTATGATKFGTMQLGALDKNAWDSQKAVNIATALSPCLENSLAEIRKTTITALTA